MVFLTSKTCERDGFVRKEMSEIKKNIKFDPNLWGEEEVGVK